MVIILYLLLGFSTDLKALSLCGSLLSVILLWTLCPGPSALRYSASSALVPLLHPWCYILETSSVCKLGEIIGITVLNCLVFSILKTVILYICVVFRLFLVVGKPSCLEVEDALPQFLNCYFCSSQLKKKENVTLSFILLLYLMGRTDYVHFVSYL